MYHPGKTTLVPRLVFLAEVFSLSLLLQPLKLCSEVVLAIYFTGYHPAHNGMGSHPPGARGLVHIESENHWLLELQGSPHLTEGTPRPQYGCMCGPKSHSIQMAEPGLERPSVTCKWFSILQLLHDGGVVDASN